MKHSRISLTAAAALLWASHAQAVPLHEAEHSVLGKLETINNGLDQTNHNWAGLTAVCTVTVNADDDGTMNGIQSSPPVQLRIELSAPEGSGSSVWRQLAADKECHVGFLRRVSPDQIHCTFTGKKQKTPQKYDSGATGSPLDGDDSSVHDLSKDEQQAMENLSSSDPIVDRSGHDLPRRTGKGQSFSNKYFRLSLISTERLCHDDTPPPPPPIRHIPIEGLPPCFNNEAARAAAIAGYRQQIKMIQGWRQHETDAGENMFLARTIDAINEAIANAQKLGICPPTTTGHSYPPPQHAGGTVTYSGTTGLPPCFETDYLRRKFFDDLYEQRQTLLANLDQLPVTETVERANLLQHINDITVEMLDTEKTPLCKHESGLKSLLGHVSIGVGIGHGDDDDRDRRDDRRSDKQKDRDRPKNDDDRPRTDDGSSTPHGF